GAVAAARKAVRRSFCRLRRSDHPRASSSASVATRPGLTWTVSIRGKSGAYFFLTFRLPLTREAPDAVRSAQVVAPLCDLMVMGGEVVLQRSQACGLTKITEEDLKEVERFGHIDRRHLRRRDRCGFSPNQSAVSRVVWRRQRAIHHRVR